MRYLLFGFRWTVPWSFYILFHAVLQNKSFKTVKLGTESFLSNSTIQTILSISSRSLILLRHVENRLQPSDIWSKDSRCKYTVYLFYFIVTSKACTEKKLSWFFSFNITSIVVIYSKEVTITLWKMIMLWHMEGRKVIVKMQNVLWWQKRS